MIRRAGFTMIETMLAVVIVGVLTLMAYPRVNSAVVRSDARAARTRVINMLAMARTAATQTNRSTWLTFNGNQVWVTASPRRTIGGTGTVDTLGSVVDLSAAYGTSATVSGGITQIAYDPRGLASGFGSGVTITLVRGGYSYPITVDMLGRVTK